MCKLFIFYLSFCLFDQLICNHVEQTNISNIEQVKVAEIPQRKDPSLAAKILKVNKEIVLAPFTFGAKVVKANMLMVPMVIGAGVGAPIGAIIGAKVGAVNGANLAKSLALKKADLIKKGAVKAANGVKNAISVPIGWAKLALNKKTQLINNGASAVAAQGASMFSKIHHKIHHSSSSIKGSYPKIQQEKIVQMKFDPSAVDAMYKMNSSVVGHQHEKPNIQFLERKRRYIEDIDLLVKYVNSRGQSACLQKVICELSGDPNLHGKEGVRFGSALLQYSLIETETTAPFMEAFRYGTMSESSDACAIQYNTCNVESIVMIRFGLEVLNV